LTTTADGLSVGTSKNTYNVQGYFENKSFSARVAYTYRVVVLQWTGSEHGVYAIQT